MRRIKGVRLFTIAFILLLCALLFYKKLFLFSLVLVLAAMLQAFSYKGDLKYNLGHVFFLAILVQKSVGTSEAIILLVFAGFLPKMFSGEVDLKGLISLPLEIVLVMVISFFTWSIFIGIMAAFFNYFFVFLLAKSSGESVPEIFAEVFLPFFMNLIYFLSISGPLGNILGYLTLI